MTTTLTGPCPSCRRRAMARELGYTLAVTARWRRNITSVPAPFSMYPERLADARFRPQPRIIRTLDTRSEARGRAVVRFSAPRGRDWSPSDDLTALIDKLTPRERSFRKKGRGGETAAAAAAAAAAEKSREEEEIYENVEPTVKGAAAAATASTSAAACSLDDGRSSNKDKRKSIISACGVAATLKKSRVRRRSSTRNDIFDNDEHHTTSNKRKSTDRLTFTLDRHSLIGAPPTLPDPVQLSKDFVEKLAARLSQVDSKMILCTDETLYIHELIAARDIRRLNCLIYRFHLHHVLLTWPPGWVFTVIDATRSPRLQKASAAVVRDGHVCCEQNLIAIGVVHDLGREPSEAEYPVILVNLDGFVYMYDDGGVVPVLHLLTKCGFSDFCRRGLRERCGIGLDAGSTPIDYTEDPLKSILESRSSIDDLVVSRDRLLGAETAIFHSDSMWTLLTVSNLCDTGYDSFDYECWKHETGQCRLEPVFMVKACVSGVWVNAPILVSDGGTVYYVDPGHGNIKFLAADLFTFLVLGVMRFRNSNCFLPNTFPQRRLEDPRPGQPIRPVFCPLGQRCRRKRRVSIISRFWHWLWGTWGYVTVCCRHQ
ncbi:US22 family protein [Murid betaherpesvirus 1]|uniref:US22 family protein n=3 Tax=Muromegalovirus muridbeta1 TaxID=3050323 RepID=D3XDN1_MUHVS|nr:US22 family protein [Murid betaherpesvirus 1]YP_214055.1 US22 family homolog [Murid betaherpesvirus 1]CAP08090.1 M43 protein [Murine cytomegalovirus (strain K181)]ADD10425.1 US22 family protein [Murid betaherpesvirus 1]AQQ81329.1 M43 protein [Murid betaherpesvirus 1]WEG71706.1 tegument protein UL43 [Murid betaherpesvirus 1]CAJ1013267.1 M43 protein [Murid betaherpesvirus 1]